MNINEAKKISMDMTNWRKRKQVARTLSKMNCQQSKDIIMRMTIHDPSFFVREEALKSSQKLKVTKKGRPLYLKGKKKGILVSGIDKKVLVVKRNLPEKFTLEEFKEKFHSMYPEAYDVYDGNYDKKHFERWLKHQAGKGLCEPSNEEIDKMII